MKERRQVVSVQGKVLTVDENMTPGANKGAHVYGYSGMGAHSVMVADVDEDGKDEIVYGSMVVDDNGQGLFTTGLRHGDALHVAKMDPDRPGLQVYGPHENEGSVWDQWTPGVALYDAKSGRIIWSMGDGGDAERGITGDIDPRYRGEELWGSLSGVRTCKGEPIAPQGPSMTNFVVWWDGDLLREMVNGNRIAKWDWQTGTMTTLLTAEGAQAAAGTKQSPVISADILGDWREEVVLRSRQPGPAHLHHDDPDRAPPLHADARPAVPRAGRRPERDVQPAAAPQLLPRRRHEGAAKAEPPAGGAEQMTRGISPAASSNYFRNPASVPERLILASSMVPGFQSRAICTSAATFSVCLGMSTTAGAVVEHGLNVLARVGGGVILPVAQGRFEVLHGGGLLLGVAAFVEEREVAGTANLRRVVEARDATWLRCRRAWRRILWRCRQE